MRILNKFLKIFPVAVLLVTLGSCEKDYYYVTPPPKTSVRTSSLEASRVSAPITSLNDNYWKTADYLLVNSANVSTNNLYEDGYLNMTASYLGLASFNKGTDPGLKLKAAYDNENVYILAEWTDYTVNLSNGSWIYRGLGDTLKPSETSAAWTSQRNGDKLAFAFDLGNASSPAGSFSSVGCAASCHSNLGSSVMYPSSGKVDIWNWDLALSSPLGYAVDMVANTDSLAHDNGNRLYYRNSNGNTGRSGPAYEWDGSTQTVTLPNGQSSILDPAFYLFNKTAFIGNIQRGDSIYQSATPPGDCVSCHGSVGQGGSSSIINTISQNKKSRAALMASMDNIADMAPYWLPLSQQDRDDIVAYLRGLSGVPGYYLNTPDGSNADIKAISNLTPIQVKNAMLPVTNVHTVYQLLITRKLNTTNTDDAQFDLTTQRSYTFGVALMDNDGKNHIGSLKETLIFK